MKRPTGTLNAYCSVKEANLKRPFCMIPTCDNVAKTKPETVGRSGVAWGLEDEVEGGGGAGQAKRRGMLGQGNHSG